MTVATLVAAQGGGFLGIYRNLEIAKQSVKDSFSEVYFEEKDGIVLCICRGGTTIALKEEQVNRTPTRIPKGRLP